MPIGGWVLFVFTAIFIMFGGCVVAIETGGGKASVALTIVIVIILIATILFGLLWYFDNTAVGRRMMIDQKSNFNNGIERTITVYTANGEIIAEYSGLIDIETNDGGYVKFDFEGKRYIYYNCFVETIAVIE